MGELHDKMRNLIRILEEEIGQNRMQNERTLHETKSRFETTLDQELNQVGVNMSTDVQRCCQQGDTLLCLARNELEPYQSLMFCESKQTDTISIPHNAVTRNRNQVCCIGNSD